MKTEKMTPGGNIKRAKDRQCQPANSSPPCPSFFVVENVHHKQRQQYQQQQATTASKAEKKGINHSLS